ncbi:hypothetical protein I4U23_025631 [Adineta vaga]|nr:hypothetical protein I4U23_025631 [Adineta vaga]
MLNKNENQYNEHDHHEISIKSARVIKRYMELVYHLQSFYERITDQLSNGNCFLKTNQSLFINHCRKIIEQLQKFKPIWDEKLVDLQKQLKDFSTFQWSTEIDQTTFLKRRLTLINLLQMLNKEKELDNTDLSIRTDIDRVLHDDKLAVQLQDELSTLLQHQCLLNDFTSLLQWNSPIYSSNEQNRVETILPILREQMTTTDSYMTHVSQQLTELVTDLRSSEKYILSYTNTIPLINDELVPPQQPLSKHDHSRSYDKTDVNPIRTREYRLQQSHRNEKTNDNSSKIRSTSVPRHVVSDNSIPNLDRDDLRISININNSNNNGISTRFAAVKSAKREIKTPSNVKSILKSNSQIQSSNGRKTEYDIDTELVQSHRIFNDNERKIFSKQNIHESSEFNLADNDIRFSFDRKGLSEKRQHAYNLQSMVADGTKEKSRFVAVKQYSNKSYQQLLFYPNA